MDDPDPASPSAEVEPDVWMQERLARLAGRHLTQFRVNAHALILDFWEIDDDYNLWLYADKIGFGRSGNESVQQLVRRTSSAAITATHGLLDREVAEAEVVEGRLRLAFADGSEVAVDPEPDSQAWALTFEGGGLVECNSGGAMNVRME